MANLASDFRASISIVNSSSITKGMLVDLPDNYERQSQNTNVFAALYGSGYSLEQSKRTFKQVEANNYLYSPDIQEANFNVSGAGKYLIEFDIPFTTPPLDVSIVGSSFTDVFVEYTSRFGMIVNVQSEAQDVLKYRASGTVGAASDEYIGDALFLNFGSLYQFPRVGDSIINDTFVKFYEQANTFVSLQNIIPVETVVSTNPLVIQKNYPPLNSQFLTGIIEPCNVSSKPRATHQLVDIAGNLIALLDSSAVPKSIDITAFYNNSNQNIYKNDVRVFVLGQFSKFVFNRWLQPTFIQEVFRADNKYRRLLYAISKSLNLGPTVAGAANMTEALISQPYIPFSKWQDNDYRIFKNAIGQDSPKYISYNKDINGIITGVNSDSQLEGYPTVPPIVEIKRTVQPWNPDTITYNNKPALVPLDVPVSKQITELNSATRFDVTNELTKQLRLGIDLPQGGIINWNYSYSTLPNGAIPTTGFSLYETYNYMFLNNPGDSITNINIFWHAQQFNINGPTSYRTFGPLQNGRDFFAISTDKFLLQNGTYDLPSELLVGYKANSNKPYYDGSIDAFGNTSWKGNDLVNQNILPHSLPSLPSLLIQLDLRLLSINNVNNKITKMPTNNYDFIFYSYGQINTTQADVRGKFSENTIANSVGNTISYYDSDTSSSLQPQDSPFATAFNRLSPISLAQSPFAKMVTVTGYEYIITMVGGQVTFEKTVYAELIKRQSSYNPNSDVTPPGVFVLQVTQVFPGVVGTMGQVGTNQYKLSGIVAPMINSSGKRYFESGLGDYVILDTNQNPIAILANDSFVSLSQLVGSVHTVLGVVEKTIWDTRIPVTEYRTNSPIFQVSNNFDAQTVTFTPDIRVNAFVNNNFLVVIDGLPLGNQQTITASWTFNIVPSSSQPVVNTKSLSFSDRSDNNTILRGIMSMFTGLSIQQSGKDPEDAIYSQIYVSPSFNSYFINYKDYINQIGTKLSPFGDRSNGDTLTNPILQKPSPGAPSSNTILNLFSPSYGFMSVSILPNQEFYLTGSGTPVSIVRPNNHGFGLQIKGDSYAGLVFYGKNSDAIVDKPTRLLADFTYSSAGGETRKKTIEIEDGGFGNYVDGKNPDEVQSGAIFFIAGNSFKYTSTGYDQAVNQYSDNNPHNTENSGQYYDRNPIVDSDGTIPYRIFESDPSQNSVASLSNGLGKNGPPHRYRRPPIANSSIGTYNTPEINSLNQSYYNITPEKIAYLQFDFSSLPIDAIVNNGILEIYFASGFTIKQANDINFSLNKNSSWDKSRLSGNGKTYLKTLKNVNGSEYNIYQSLQNPHWRKNFFEIVIPHAFLSEPSGGDFGIGNLFSLPSPNATPAPINPQPNLEYLGFINLDELDTSSLTNYDNFIEKSVGLANIVISSATVIYKINGILHFNYNADGTTTLANCFDKNKGVIYENLTDCINLVNNPGNTRVLGIQINELDLLPSQKVLVFPFGLNPNIFFYGYVTSTVPSSFINFDNNEIAIYKSILSYVAPLYCEYTVRLLNADSYISYKTFGRNTTIENTNKDISY